MADEELTKIFIDLPPEDGGFGGESFWAKARGNNLYELRNSPWYAYDLNFLDVVRAIPDASDEKPRIIEVVRRGGHKTLRVFFAENIPVSEQEEYLKQLNQLRAFYEGANERFYAIDVEPDGDYQAVCNQLWAWEQQGILEYETGMTNHETT
jgi:hypothetical protein